MVSASNKDTFIVLLSALEVPTRPLSSRSKRSPEWDLIQGMRSEFGLPEGLDTLDPLADYLAGHVIVDQFITYLGDVAAPFAEMFCDVQEFLREHRRTAHSDQTVTEIRIGNNTRFRVPLDHLPREIEAVLQECRKTVWNLNELYLLVDALPGLAPIAWCGAKAGDMTCRADLESTCRRRISLINNQVRSISAADKWTQARRKAAMEPVECLPDYVRASVDHYLYQIDADDRHPTWAASDCLPGQTGTSQNLPKTQDHLTWVEQILDRARRDITVQTEVLLTFFRMPYWKKRNDLYEVWSLVRLLRTIPEAKVQLNLDDQNRWHIPGNKQGRLDKPVLHLEAPRGPYFVYTGLRLGPKNRGAMPDWLFCRQVTNGQGAIEEPDKLLQGGPGVGSLLPEFVLECKCGASYKLPETLRMPMRDKYSPLMPAIGSGALLVNYRQFTVSSKAAATATERKRLRRKYPAILAIEELAPGATEPLDELTFAVRSFFAAGGPGTQWSGGPELDLAIAFDTTGSMAGQLEAIKNGIGQVADDLSGIGSGVRMGIVAIGDYGEQYCTACIPLSNDLPAVVAAAKALEGTGGGDVEEAYEVGLHDLAHLPWTSVARHAILIGDSIPHAIGSRAECKLDWREQARLLANKSVQVHAVCLGGGSESEAFLKEVSRLTNGNYTACQTGEEAATFFRHMVEQLIKSGPFLSRDGVF